MLKITKAGILVVTVEKSIGDTQPIVGSTKRMQ